MTLLELAAHLEGKAAQLRCEGLGEVKTGLAGTDTSSLLEILEECFGHMTLDTSKSTVSTEKARKETTVKEEASNLPKKIPATPSDSGGLATLEFLPFKVHPHGYHRSPRTLPTNSWP